MSDFPKHDWDIEFQEPGGGLTIFRGAGAAIVHDGTASFKMLEGNRWVQYHISGVWIIKPHKPEAPK